MLLKLVTAVRRGGPIRGVGPDAEVARRAARQITQYRNA